MRNVNVPLLEGVRRKVVGVGVVVVIDMVRCSSKRRRLGAEVAPLSSSLSSLKPLPTVSDRIQGRDCRLLGDLNYLPKNSRGNESFLSTCLGCTIQKKRKQHKSTIIQLQPRHSCRYKLDINSPLFPLIQGSSPATSQSPTSTVDCLAAKAPNVAHLGRPASQGPRRLPPWSGEPMAVDPVATCIVFVIYTFPM